MTTETVPPSQHPCSPSHSEAACNWAGHVTSSGQQTINESTMCHFKVDEVKNGVDGVDQGRQHVLDCALCLCK